MRKRKWLALLLTICMVISLVPMTVFAVGENPDEPGDGNASETHTVNFGTGSWTVGEQTVTADRSGTINALAVDAVITLTGFNADTMQAKLTAEDGFTTTLTVAEGQTSLSAKNCDGLPDGTLTFSVEAKNDGESGNNPGEQVIPGIAVNAHGIGVVSANLVAGDTDEWGWTPYDFQGSGSATLTFDTSNPNYHGIMVRTCKEGDTWDDFTPRSYQKPENGTYVITDNTKFYEIEVLDWESPVYDNEYVVGYEQRDGYTVQINKETVEAWGKVKTFTQSDFPLTITTSVTPYKVIVRPNDSDEIELPMTAGGYSYSPSTNINAGFQLRIYWTEEEYAFDTIPFNWETQFIAEYQVRYDKCPQSAGSVTYDVTPSEVRSYDGWTRMVLNKGTAEVKLNITASEGYIYEVRVNGQNVTESVADNKYTWAVGENSEIRPEIVFRSENGGDNPGGENPDGSALTIELSDSKSVSDGTFTYDHGTARVMFVRGSSDGAYDGSNTSITLTNDVTAVKIILTADEGYQGVIRTGGNNPPVPNPEVTDGVSTYTFERSAMEAAGNFIAFNIEFTGESGGDNPGGNDPEPFWHTVSWGGENVTVEHGTVAAERVHLGDKVFTVNRAESGASDSDKIYPIEDIIGKEGQEGLGNYGLGYGDTDLFIDNSVSEAVSIDFKFVPDYGYQLSDILTNESVSLLDDFTASVSEISTFNFAVRPDGGNVHFNVEFAAAKDTMEVNSESVTDASIANGENATDSGNLKMTVADIGEDAVSDALKAQAGQDALYLDMNLYQVVSKGGNNGNWQTQLEELKGKITVTLNVPAPAEGSSYYIVREHGDGENRTYSRIEVTFVPDKNDPTKGTVTFETDKFSNYALAQITSNLVDTSEKIENPAVSSDSWTDALPAEASTATAVKLKVADNTDATDTVKDALASTAGVTPNADKSFYLDIDLNATVGGSDIRISELSQPVTVTLTVPEIASDEKYTVVRQHMDGSDVSYEKLDSTYDRTTSKLQFQTDKFSVYAVLVSSAHTHSLTLVPAQSSTCTATGNTAYYTCSCGKWFADAAGNVEIADHSSVVVPAQAHTASGWKFDGSNHWKVCTKCSAEIASSKAAHSYGDDNVCDVCGYTKSVPAPSYSFLEGENGEWKPGSDGTLRFRANGDFAKFTGVKVDGSLVDPKHYTAVSGSTIITFTREFLETLSAGEHQLTVTFVDGECSTAFSIEAAQSTGTPGHSGTQTGDNSNVILWTALLIIACVGMFVIKIYGRKGKYCA